MINTALPWQRNLATRLIGALPLPLIQPALTRIVRRIAATHRDIFDRLGPYREATYVIEPADMPFVLVLCPDPERPQLRAVRRDTAPAAHDARITGAFLTLFDLIDAGADGDALFFSRDLVVSGDTEAVVRLRNALDDVEGSIATDVAAQFGPPGRFVLARLRGAAATSEFRET